MKILRSASAGTMESSDVYIEVMPNEGGISVELESIVKDRFGAEIESSVREVLSECGVDSAAVRVVDRGALDCVIRARVETAICRAGGEE